MICLTYTLTSQMNKEKYTFCFVFAMGMEAAPFLRRVETRRRWKVGHTTNREVFFEGKRILVTRCGIGYRKALAAGQSIGDESLSMVSVGTCGALVEGLRPGHILIASETVLQENPNVRHKCSEALVSSLQLACSRAGVQYRVAPIVTASKPVFARSDRETLHMNSGAHAVDMESHALAIGASSAGSPFGVIRVVSDGIEAAPLPDRAILINWRKQLSKIHENVLPLIRWWRFLRTFRNSIAMLDEPLVELTRIQGRFGSNGVNRADSDQC
jgi:nucleoside phosphorylase